MQTVAFREITTPFERAERLRKRAVLVTAHHQVVLRIEQILIVQCSLAIRLKFFVRLAQLLAQLPDTPVVVGIFQRPGSILIDSDIARNIAETVVVFPAKASRRAHLRMHFVSA